MAFTMKASVPAKRLAGGGRGLRLIAFQNFLVTRRSVGCERWPEATSPTLVMEGASRAALHYKRSASATSTDYFLLLVLTVMLGMTQGSYKVVY